MRNCKMKQEKIFKQRCCNKVIQIVYINDRDMKSCQIVFSMFNVF